MYTKKEFYRLLNAKRQIDGYLSSMVWYWTKKHQGAGVHYDSIKVVDYPSDDFITLRINGDKNHELTIPTTYMHDPDIVEHATMLWYSDYYDGPITGLAEYQGKKVWFNWFEDAPLTDLRIYNFHEMTDEEVEYEEADHQRFRDLIGKHCDYGDKEGSVNYTDESFEEYYHSPEKTIERDYTTNKVVVTLDETFVDRGYPKKDVDND